MCTRTESRNAFAWRRKKGPAAKWNEIYNLIKFPFRRVPFRIYCQSHKHTHAAEDIHSHESKTIWAHSNSLFRSWNQTFFTMTNQRGETEYARRRIMHVFYCGAGFVLFLSLHVSRAARSADERASFCRKKSTSCDRTMGRFFLSNNEWNGEDMVANRVWKFRCCSWLQLFAYQCQPLVHAWNFVI